MADVVHGTCPASGIHDVEVDGDARTLEIINRDGAGEIYFLIDTDENPTVGGRGCDVLPAAINFVRVTSRARGTTLVRMVATAETKYTVKVVDDE